MRQFILYVCFFFSIGVAAQSESIRTKHFNTMNGVALQGYDPVAYFEYHAIKGNAHLTATYQGVTYCFASEAHKSTFLQNPSYYEPQYGGWCAFAMGDYAKKVEVNPETFKIVNGKLYLFYNAYFTNTLNDWNKNENTLRTQADQNWTSIIQK